MSLQVPVLLTANHQCEGFGCGKPALNDWLVRRGLANQLSGASRTLVVVDDTSAEVVGYYESSDRVGDPPRRPFGLEVGWL